MFFAGSPLLPAWFLVCQKLGYRLEPGQAGATRSSSPLAAAASPLCQGSPEMRSADGPMFLLFVCLLLCAKCQQIPGVQTTSKIMVGLRSVPFSGFEP